MRTNLMRYVGFLLLALLLWACLTPPVGMAVGFVTTMLSAGTLPFKFQAILTYIFSAIFAVGLVLQMERQTRKNK